MKRKIKLISIALSLMLLGGITVIYTGCKKDDEVKTIEPVYVVNDSIKPNVSIVKSTDATLLSDSVQQEQGMYILDFNGTPPNYKSGDVIVGQEGEGFLRKVVSSSVSGNTVTLQTEQADLFDMYKKFSFEFDAVVGSNKKNSKLLYEEIEYIAPNVKNTSGDGINLALTNVNLKVGSNFSAKLINASISINPDFKCSGSIDDDDLKISFTALNMPVNFGYNFSVTGKVEDKEKTETTLLRKKTYHMVGFVVFTVVHVVKVVYEPSINVAINYNYNATNNYTYDIGAVYNNGTFNPIFEKKSETNSVLSNSLEVTTGGEMKLSLVYEPVIKIFGLPGPYTNATLYGQIKGNISTAKDWDLSVGRGLSASAGIKMKIFKKLEIDKVKTWNLEVPDFYVLPKTLEYTSGNAQSGNYNTALSQPLKVKVLDNLGYKVSNVNVYFTPSSNSGNVANSVVKTDENGYAETIWTLGSSGTQEVSAQVKKADGSAISGSPLSFTATCGCSTFMDGAYEAVQIGTQIWMAKNLNIVTANSWVYPGVAAEYGRLYTWNAALTACPTGWHLPSDAEWTTLTNYLGGTSVAGGKLKATGTTYWRSPNTGATNETCFTALAGGNRNLDGTFGNIGYYGTLWSASAYDATYAWGRHLNWGTSVITTSYYGKEAGFCVRCLKD